MKNAQELNSWALGCQVLFQPDTPVASGSSPEVEEGVADGDEDDEGKEGDDESGVERILRFHSVVRQSNRSQPPRDDAHPPEHEEVLDDLHDSTGLTDLLREG